jgi:hypothetical protein
MINVDNERDYSILEDHSVSNFVELYEWTVYLVGGSSDTIHFLGNTGVQGRVSSPIIEYDNITKIGKTYSGETFQLCGENGCDSEAIRIFSKWLGIIGAPGVEDISERYI